MNAPFLHLECTDSTNLEIQRRLAAGAVADGTAVLSDFQTAGRGRLQRAWVSEAGNSMLCSFWCELELPYHELGGFSLLPSLAVTDYLAEISVQASCKWPNDVRWNGRKLCGILSEGVPGRRGIHGVIVGIGMNLLRSPSLADTPFPPVSLLEICSSNPPEAETVARGIRRHLLRRKEDWRKGIRAPQMEEWLARCDHLGVPANITVDGRKIEGIMRGLGTQGQLLLEVNGQTREVWADDVFPVDKDSGGAL